MFADLYVFKHSIQFLIMLFSPDPVFTFGPHTLLRKSFTDDPYFTCIYLVLHNENFKSFDSIKFYHISVEEMQGHPFRMSEMYKVIAIKLYIFCNVREMKRVNIDSGVVHSAITICQVQ